MKNLNQYLRGALLSGIIFLSINSSAQWKPDLHLRPGLNSFCYVADASSIPSDVIWIDKYFQNQIISPVLGLELNWPSINLSITGSYYGAFISNPTRPPNNYEINDIKYAGAVDIVYNWDKFRLGLILSNRDYRRKAGLTYLNPSPNMQRGLGLTLGFPLAGFEFELRKELVWAADNKFNPWAGGALLNPVEAWNLRLSYPINIFSASERFDTVNHHNHFSEKSGLNIQGGLSLSGNPNYELTFGTSRSIMIYTFGLEYFYKRYNSSVFFRRSQSLKMSVQNGVLNEYIQNNYLGYAFWIPIADKRYMKLELSHNWAFNRYSQVLINDEVLEPPIDYEEFIDFGEYDNRSVGIGVRYPINSYMDIFGNLDLYYQANRLSELGFAPNSLSFGALFHFQPR